jgi:hypothetical protein
MSYHQIMQAYTLLEQNALNTGLKPISLRGFLFLNQSPCDVYGLENDLYKILLKKNSYIDTGVLKNLIKLGHTKVFVPHKQHPELIDLQQDELIKVTRSLSIGPALENAKKLVNLLTVNMTHLYDFPTDDKTLNLQVQSIKNLCMFLYSRPQIHAPLYYEFCKQKHHFIVAQPFISSLFLLGVLKQSRMFSDKEVENLFLTSYFKDIGMSSIPTEKFDKDNLSHDEKILLARHAGHSVQILQGRLTLAPQYFKIIQNHHSFSLLTRDMDLDKSQEQLAQGFETMIVSVMDIIAAMITERPYRPSVPIFESLELIKVLIIDEFPHEFRIIVGYFRNFFQD